MGEMEKPRAGEVQEIMYLRIEIEALDNGYVEASCPELGLTTAATSFEEAMDKIKAMLIAYFSEMGEATFNLSRTSLPLGYLNPDFKDKYLHIPPDQKPH
ncbi:MAG: hypothetical protein P9M00_01555 [Candidatus Tritonobacter lacicola]|nr:hypothetical protein [Candidatus Tritonobacter lacicola]